MNAFILDYRRNFLRSQEGPGRAGPSSPQQPVPLPSRNPTPVLPFAQAALGVAALLAALGGLASVTPVQPGDTPWLPALRDFLHSFAVPGLIAFCGMAVGPSRTAPWPAYIARRLLPVLGALGLWAGTLVGLTLLQGQAWPSGVGIAFARIAPLAPMGAALVVLPLFILAWKALGRLRTGAVFVLAALLEIMHTEQGGLIWIEAMRGFAYFAAGHVLAPHLRAIARFTRANVTTAGLMLSCWFGFNALMTSATLPLAFGEKIATLPFASLGLGLAGLCALTVAGELVAGTRLGGAALAIGQRWKLWYGCLPLAIMAMASGLDRAGLFATPGQAVSALLLSALAGAGAMAIAELRAPQTPSRLRRTG